MGNFSVDQKVQELTTKVSGQSQEVIVNEFKLALTEAYNAGLEDFTSLASQLKDKSDRPAPGTKKFVKIAQNLKIR